MNKLRISPDLSLPLEAVTQTFALLAKRGSGKTYTAAVMIEEMAAAALPVAVLDPVGVLWGLRASADGKGPGLPVVILGGEHGDVPLESTAGTIIADFVIDARRPVVLDLSLFRKGEQARFVTDFAERLYHKNREPLHLVVDEADLFAPQRPMPGEQRMLGAMEDIVRRGRARGLGVTLITQRPAVLHKDVLTQVEVLVALRLIAPQDRAAVDAWVKVHGTPEQRDELMASLPSLPIGTAWFWSPGWLDVFKKVAIRKRTTFDSSATPTMGTKALKPKTLAPVELDDLRDRIASTIEKAKQEDPKELRRRIAELEQLLKTAKTHETVRVDRVEVPVLTKEDRALLSELAGDIEDLGPKFRAALDWFIVAADRFQKTPATSFPPAVRHALAGPPRAASTRKTVTTPLPIDGVKLGKGERATMIAIAQHQNGVTREQLTILTGYKRSTRDAYLQRLRNAGFVQDLAIVATDAGIAWLGHDYEPLPTGDALRKHWLGKLPEGERKVLEILCGAYPNAVLRDTIDEKTGYARSSRDAYLQRLGARKLVEGAGRGADIASRELFG